MLFLQYPTYSNMGVELLQKVETNKTTVSSEPLLGGEGEGLELLRPAARAVPSEVAGNWSVTHGTDREWLACNAQGMYGTKKEENLDAFRLSLSLEILRVTAVWRQTPTHPLYHTNKPITGQGSPRSSAVQGHSAHSTTRSCPSIGFKMGRGKTITVEQRAGQFKADQFYVSDSKILMCRICYIRLESNKKDGLNKHVSAGHLWRKEEQKTHGLKRQLLITEVCDKQKKARTEKLVFIDDTVKMCLKANIPINKLDHPTVREYLK
uniref:(California timema) hypothetical protein n=1 Tax=Timema californicum TaxID=61474 RepID=A0A7R9JHR0_TIMCA|nr:unnamed protein product [Timema californicum]